MEHMGVVMGYGIYGVIIWSIIAYVAYVLILDIFNHYQK